MNPRLLYLFLFFIIPLHDFGQVSLKNILLQNPDTNLVYIGISNKIQVAGIKNRAGLKVEANGMNCLPYGNFTYEVPVSSPGPVLLKVYSGSKLVISKLYTAKRIPAPMASLVSFRDTTISRVTLLSNKRVHSILPGCQLAYNLKIISFQLNIISKNRELMSQVQVYGDTIPDDYNEMLKKLEPGDQLKFENIRIAGPDDWPIDSFALTII